MRLRRRTKARAAGVLISAATAGLAGWVLAPSARGTTYTWNNTGSGNWSVAGNWVPGTPVSSTTNALIFGGSSAYTATDDIGNGTFSLNNLTISNTAATTIAPNASGNSLTFGGTNASLMITAGAGPATINNNLIFASTNSTVTNNSSNLLTLGGTVTYNASTITTFTGPGSITAATAQTFGASSSLVYTGSGTLTLGPTSGTGIAFGSGTVNITNGVSGGGSTGMLTLADGGTYSGSGTLNLYNYSSGQFNIGNMSPVTGTINIMAGTVEFLPASEGGNTSGDLFGNSVTLNVASGATWNFSSNGETMGAISGSGTITGASMTLELTGNHTWAGNIAGSSLTLGTSTITNVNYTLTGTNTTTGTLTINPGSFASLGNGGTTGSWAGKSIVDNGTLIFNRSNAYTYTGVISGGGVVNIAGASGGVITFSGSNTYSGTTNVTGGTLAITSATALPTGAPTNVVDVNGGVLDVSAVSGYTFAANQDLIVGRTGTPATDVVGSPTVQGTLDVGGINTVATATFSGSLTLSGATLNLDLGSSPGTGTDLLNVAGNLTLSGSNTININNPAGGSGTYTVITYGGTLSGNASNLAVSASSAGRGTYTVDTTSKPGAVLLDATYTPANLTWVGNTSNNVWDLTQTVNWTGAPGPNPDNRFYNGDNVTFDDTGVGGSSNPVMINSVVQPGSVTFNGTQSYTLVGSSSAYIAGIGGMTINSTGTITIDAPNTFTGPTNANAGTLTINSSGSIGGALNVNGATVNLGSGAVSKGPITVNSGTVNLANNTGYTGTITINGGMVNSAPGAFNTNITINGGELLYASNSDVVSTNVVTINGGTLGLPAGMQYSTGSDVQPWVIGPNGATIDVPFGSPGESFGSTPPGDGKQGNSISGSGPLTFTSSSGYGVFNVGSNKSTFTGTTTVMPGATLRFTSNQFTSAASITVESGATYLIYDTTSGPYNLASGATLNLNGDGVPLQGTGVGGSDVGGAFMHVPDPGEGLSPNYAINIPVVLQSNARITQLDANPSTGYSGSGVTTDIFTKQISGPGNLIKDGDGVMVVANNSATTPNNYTGMTIISNGIMQLSNGGNTSATLAGGGGNLLPVGTTVQLGEAAYNNSGTLDLYGNAQTIAGLTTAGSGSAQQVINSNSTTAASLTVNYAGSSPQSFSGQIGGASGSDAIAFTKSGSGTFALTGTNYYTGATTVAAGTLAIGSQSALPSNSPIVTVASGSVLDLSAVSGGYSFASNQKLVVGRPGGGANDVLGSTTINGTLDIGGPNNPVTATFQNALTLNNATIDFDLGNRASANNDLVVVGGNLQLFGTNNIQVTLIGGSLTNGNYKLFTYGGSLDGDATNLSLSGITAGTTRQSYTFDTTSTPGAVLLDVAGSAANLTWVGNSNTNNWDLVTTPNFSGGTVVPPGTTPDNRFYNLDNVTFDGTGVGDPTPVNLVGTLSPASVTVTGGQNYTFSGSGSIAGSGPLNMNGTGTLTISTANTFTGTTTASAGTLTFTSGGSVGGALIVNGGTVNLVAGAVTEPVTVSSGTVNTAASTGLSNTFVVNGGTVNAASGAFNNGITINGGLVNGANGAFAGNIALNGGTLAYASGTDVASNSIVTINGGTLSLPASVQYSTGSAVQPWVIGANGATINVPFGSPTTQFGAGPTVDAKQGNSISGSGPLTFTSSSGYGVFNVGQSLSTFTGTTTVMPGAMIRFTSNQFSSAGNITIESGATYQIYDTTSGPYSLGAGSSLILNGDGVPLQGTGVGGSNVGGAFLHVPDPGEGLSPEYAINLPIVLQTNARITELNANVQTGYSGPGVTTDIFTKQISGPGNLIKDGDGVMVVANNSTTTPNDYTGTTIVSNGTLQLSNGGTTAATLAGGGSNLLPPGTTVQLGEAAYNNSGTLDLYGNTQTIAGLTTTGSGTAQQVINSNPALATLTINYAGSSPQTFSGQIGGGTTASPANNAISLIKTGSGALILTGKNTLAGSVVINGGTLLVNGQTGSDSGTGTAPVAVNAGGTLGGNGNVAGTVAVNNSGNSTPGGVISAGTTASTGVLTTGAETWDGGSDSAGTGGGTYVWKFNVNSAGTPGTLNTDKSGTNWDELTMSGLTLSATAGSDFNIQIVGLNGSGGSLPAFNPSQSYSWVIANVPAGGNFANLTASAFHLNTGGAGPASYGQFTVGTLNNDPSDPGFDDVVLSYSPAPEPGSLALAALSAGGLLLRRRRTR